MYCDSYECLCFSCRIWDWFFYDGSIVLFQLTLGMLKTKEPTLHDLENSAQIFNSLSDIPGDIDDVEALFDIAIEVGGVSRPSTTKYINHHPKNLCTFIHFSR